MNSIIQERIEESIAVKEIILKDTELLKAIEDAARLMQNALKNGNKILLCGNGGSASDSLHLTAEIVGRFQKERRAFPAISLNADVASLTAIANDYGYAEIFAREAEGLLLEGDVLIGISTSGNSENIYRAIEKAKEFGGSSIGLLGRNGGKIKEIADVSIVVPSDNTARIQESHIMIGHIICEILEEIF